MINLIPSIEASAIAATASAAIASDAPPVFLEPDRARPSSERG